VAFTIDVSTKNLVLLTDCWAWAAPETIKVKNNNAAKKGFIAKVY
jgi:hypothetical protein